MSKEPIKQDAAYWIGLTIVVTVLVLAKKGWLF